LFVCHARRYRTRWSVAVQPESAVRGHGGIHVGHTYQTNRTVRRHARGRHVRRRDYSCEGRIPSEYTGAEGARGGHAEEPNERG